MFKLRELPFDINENAIISSEICKFHYGKHHQAYVTNLNNLIKNTSFASSHLFDIINEATGAIFNNAAQVFNHDFYFDCIAQKSSANGEFLDILRESFNDFKSEFINSANSLFGSGWCWLVYDLSDNILKIVNTQNADTPIIKNQVPLLVVDVWEHAYYLDYKNDRKAYLEKFYENIDWEFVSGAYFWAKKEGLDCIKSYIDSIHSECGDGCSCGNC